MTHPTRARSGELSRDRIVDAAISLLDSDGEQGLTFRALALKLQTGHGAIQWHIESKGDLLIAAAVRVLAGALRDPGPNTPPRVAIRDIALGVFDAIDAHPWLASQLFAAPWQPGMIQLWEQIGRALAQLGVPDGALFTAVSTLVSYIVGVSGQNAANRRAAAGHGSRDQFLDSVAGHWESHDPADDLLDRLAAELRVHDDRAVFSGGVDIILAGLAPNN